jgi:acetyl esterase/lipase
MFNVESHARDVRRAIRVAGHRAVDFRIDPARIGLAVDPSFEFFDVDRLTGRRTPVSFTEIHHRLRQLSAVTHVTADDPPTILIHGDRDTAAPIQQPQRLFERLQAMKVPTDLVVREGMGHSWPGWESDSALVAASFDKYLRQ